MTFKGKYILVTEYNGLDILPVSVAFWFSVFQTLPVQSDHVISCFHIVQTSAGHIWEKTQQTEKDSVVPLCDHSAAAFSKSGSNASVSKIEMFEKALHILVS